ncbi:hypothetical protein LTR37_008882 [Vermiconidia calcicola]|uniref:Uncharacterized protein n=1 Tax=Vermiconidia calcicola TaxID=1690605 RepID=A0ACC3NAW2_9PEZI|nr:hypothetical protein LTR37_008882 [Vermiconidia calcicola]
MPPKVIARNADRTGGVLPVSAAARAAPSKAPAPRLKLEVRRLPPGLTLTEFEETLGEEWKVGNGMVDWREYRQGKTRTPGAGKLPEQSRCYLHVVKEAYVKDFEKRFLEVIFHDKAGTHKNSDLKHLAPTLGFAPNQRTPLQQNKQRTDNRQGTIDQDPEFIAFLEAETQPITKPSLLEAAAEKDGTKDVKTTPLIEDLREKKANKAKAAQVKAEKAEKDKKGGKGPSKDAVVPVKEDAAKVAQPQKAEQAPKEPAKPVAKPAGAKQVQQAKTSSPAKTKKQQQQQSPKPQNATPTPTSSSPAPSSPAPQRVAPSQRQRGNADGIKKMLQKDLGIRPKPTQPAQPAATPTQTPASPPSTTSSPVQQPRTAPAPSKAPPSKPAQSPAATAEAKPPLLKAYLKHANPSQGMTEILIQQALSQYGEMANVTIDPRKGTAIAMFKSNEGLKKALEAKRVPVANGAVEVLEFRDRGAAVQTNRGGFRSGRGGRGGARGGAQGNAAASPAPAPA